MNLPFHRWLNHIYAWCAKPWIDAGKYEEFLMHMDAPLPGEEKKPATEWAREDSGFDDLLSAVAGMG